MTVIHHIPCGSFANESESRACQAVKQKLAALPGSGEWIVLSNLAHSSSPLHQSDEIDMLVIGPPGLFVVEVKHWDRAWIKANPLLADHEAEKVTAKTKRVAGDARHFYRDLGKVNGRILLTAEGKALGSTSRPVHRGVEFFTLKEIKELLDLDQPSQLAPGVVTGLSKHLERRTSVNLTGDLRRLGDFVNLELDSAPSERFHRIYRGVHTRTQDKVILHLYDLSATEEKQAEQLAGREFQTMQRLQKSPWVPRFRDSLQEVQGFVGEMKFFTVINPCAPSIQARCADKSWTTAQRVEFASLAMKALGELHGSPSSEVAQDESAGCIVHRNLCPRNVLVTAANRVLFVGFSLAKLPHADTVALAPLPDGEVEAFAAPEVRREGLTRADWRSDLFSLAASLKTMFRDSDDESATRCREVLDAALVEDPQARPTVAQIVAGLGALAKSDDADEALPQPPSESLEALPQPAYWSEDLEVPFNRKRFRVISQLGFGGIGRTFKVVEVDKATGEQFGTYVGKTVNEAAAGRAALLAYQRARAHTSYPNLSVIYEIADEWHEKSFVALLKWVEGDPLEGLSGVLPLIAEESGDASLEALLLRWSVDLCQGLARLHCAGLVHGDVSPANIVAHRGEVTLTDYDFVTPNSEKAPGHGAVAVCSPEAESGQPLHFSDDVFALAASLYRVGTDRNPFPESGGRFAKGQGVQWQDEEKEKMPVFSDFAARATSPVIAQRFASAMDALEWLKRGMGGMSPSAHVEEAAVTAPALLRRNEVPWLKSVVQVYPGGIAYGNLETRGLDSPFAVDTYVETALEEHLYDDLNARRARLVILCGNAGDGKTALLQHLAKRFGVPETKSAQRIWEAETPDGLRLKANLDGAAALGAKSANELLDEFFAPFMDGEPSESIAHLLAINDGRLLEWLDRCETGGKATVLIAQLKALLDSDGAMTPQCSYVRLIDLNSRALVGEIDRATQTVKTEFFDKLIDKLLGGEKAADIWAPCRTCSALSRCQAGRNAELLLSANTTNVGLRIRKRLSEALQAVHQRGEVHTTARELRGTLSYILFGIYYCADLHDQAGLVAPGYWDMAFDPDSPARQGEVLRELTLLDPALGSHPMIDRHLSGNASLEVAGIGQAFPQLSIASARRRAYFEWQDEEIRAVALSCDALGLAHGSHLALFREAGLRDAAGNADLRDRLCRGISRLEDLPHAALCRIREGRVPLKVTPRTPTESAFWVEKPLTSFALEPELPPKALHLSVLHRRLNLIYTYLDGRKEVLAMGYALFHVLLELESGFQLSDTTSDDLFANLTIFTQRLAQEGDASLFAWNSQDEGSIHRIAVARTDGRQRLVCTTVEGAVKP